MFASAVSSAKLHPAVAARNQRSVVARAGKYDEELIKTAVRSYRLLINCECPVNALRCSLYPTTPHLLPLSGVPNRPVAAPPIPAPPS